MLLCPAPGYRYFTRSVSDNAGGAIVVWDDERTGTDPSGTPLLGAYAARVSADGVSQWSASGVVSATAGGGGGAVAEPPGAFAVLRPCEP